MTTIEQFAAGYARRSRVTVERLRELGLAPASCHCGLKLCPGWQMVHRRELEWAERKGILLPYEKATLAEIRKREEKTNDH